MTVTPIARELLAINAIAESPFILLFSLNRSNKNAATTTTGIATGRAVSYTHLDVYKRQHNTLVYPNQKIL